MRMNGQGKMPVLAEELQLVIRGGPSFSVELCYTEIREPGIQLLL